MGWWTRQLDCSPQEGHWDKWQSLKYFETRLFCMFCILGGQVSFMDIVTNARSSRNVTVVTVLHIMVSQLYGENSPKAQIPTTWTKGESPWSISSIRPITYSWAVLSNTVLNMCNPFGGAAPKIPHGASRRLTPGLQQQFWQRFRTLFLSLPVVQGRDRMG